MGKWITKRIGEISMINMGQSPNGDSVNENEIGTPFLQGNADFGDYFPSEKYWCVKPKKIANKSDVLLSVRAPVGEINFANKKFCIGRGLASINFNIDKQYGIFALKNEIKHLKRKSQGSTFLAVNKKDIAEMMIYIPENLAEQEKIAEILSTVDIAIEKTKALIEKFKNIKEGLLQDLLTNGIDENGNIRSPETYEYKDSPLGMIPKEWDYATISDSFKLRARIGWQGLKAAEFVNDGPYVVTGTNFINGKINWDTCYRVSQKRYLQDTGIHLNNGDLVITKDGTIGKTAFIDNCPDKTTLNSGVFVIRPINKKIMPKYLYYVLNSRIFDLFMKNMLTGSTIKHLNQENFYKMLFIFPIDIKEQQNIIRTISASDEKIDTEMRQLQKLESIKKGLMQDLLTHKVPVDLL